MPVLTPARLMTVEEFEDFIENPEAGDRRFELIDGHPVEKPMPNEQHGTAGSNLHGELYVFNRERKLGRLVFETLYKSLEDPHNARQPDIAFTSKARMLPLTTRGAAPLIPDLCIEIKSPGNKITTLREKAAYYLAHGGRLVWIVYPQQKVVEVYSNDADVVILTAEDTLTGGDVLPGFEMAVRDIFASEEDVPETE